MARLRTFLCFLLCCFPVAALGQPFVRVTTGAFATDAGNNLGASWVDFNNDGWLDLFVARSGGFSTSSLYENNHDGTFTTVTGDPLVTTQGSVLGTCWADYDNDGWLDVFNAGAPSRLYHNNGDGTFALVTSGDIGGATDNRGWSCAWGDYDNDGFVDLFIAHPANFVGFPPIPNRLYRNNGDGSFTQITDTPITNGTAPYTVGNWIDFDLDGDLDLFIGSGPATGALGPDFIFQNALMETGTATFTRITDGPLGGVNRDGQTWNFIDYDNDGDRDGFVTNYQSAPNQLYRNDEGTYVPVTGIPLVNNSGNSSLANVWEDFDNDGDLDVFIANEAGEANTFFINSGHPDYTFTLTNAFAGTTQGNYGATAGDYDNDGDLDLMVPTTSGGPRLFYRNDLGTGAHWLRLKLEGTQSNRAGIGVKVWAKATVGGNTYWQFREVSSQNTFNGHSSLDVHLGFGDATTVDSLVLAWPAGTRDVLTDVPADQVLMVQEGQHVASEPTGTLPQAIHLAQNYPNPFNPTTQIRFSLAQPATIRLAVYDVQGRHLAVLRQGVMPAGAHTVTWDATDAQGRALPSGLYFYRLEAGSQTLTRGMSLLR